MKAALAMALAHDTKLLILDEATCWYGRIRT